MNGHIKIHRQLLDSEVFASEKRLKIWIWLLCKANYKDRHIPITIGAGQKTISIKRSQLIFGRYSAEEELNISGSTIYKTLQWMEKEGMIKIESNSHYTILTINNYDTYQVSDHEQVTADEQPRDSHATATRQPENTPKQSKQGKKRKEATTPTLQQVIDYFKEKGYTEESAKKAFEFYDVAGWVDSRGNPVLSWKQKMIQVWFKPENLDRSQMMI